MTVLPRWVLGMGLAAILGTSGLIVAGAAAASTSHTHSRSGGPAATRVGAGGWFLENLAGHLGVSTATLETAVRQSETDQVAKLLAAGRITAARAQALDRRIQRSKGVILPMRMTRRAPAVATLLPAAASYLGMTVPQLRADLRQGQSLDAIANAQGGKSAAGLQAALVAAAERRVQAQVTARRLTAAQEQARLAQLERRLPRLLARSDGGAWTARRLPAQLLDLASTYLGVSTDQIRADLRAGQSLNAIANAQPGKSAAGLAATVTAAIQSRLQAQLTAGKITGAQEQTRLNRAKAVLTRILARTAPQRGSTA